MVPVRNTYGRGPARAIRYGIDHVHAPVVVVTMADGSDDAEQIDELCKLVERGVVVAAASRYMSGGQQIGGPMLKSLLSRLAGLSLYWFAHVGTRDATNSFKAYSVDFVRDVRHRLRHRLRDRHRARGEGAATSPAGRRDPDDLARARAGRVELQGGEVDPPVPQVVPVRLRTQAVARRRARSRKGIAIMSEHATTDQKVLVSGSSGFIGGYLVEDLLGRGYTVVGIDNHSKYGRIEKSYDDHPRYTLVEGDCRDVDLMTKLLMDCDHFIAGAALIGGISYFHTFAYDLLATNERIMASSCDAAIAAHREGRLQKVTYMSSSMVFESADRWPSYEGQEREVPPPISSYGFQKLAVEYYARAAHSQYGLPYTIVRPFNCVGTGEMRAKTEVEVMSGNVKLAMSHVVPTSSRRSPRARTRSTSSVRATRCGTTPTAPTSPGGSSTPWSTRQP